MKKTFRTVLLAALLCFGVLSTGVLATGVSYPQYIAADGTTKELTENCQELPVQEGAPNKYTATVSDGWYHIDQDIEGKTISTLTVNGTVNLVLYDSARSVWINSITGNGTLNIYAGDSGDTLGSISNYVSCVLKSISGVSVNLYGGRYSTSNGLPESGWALGNGFCFLCYKNGAEVYTTTFSGGSMNSEFATVVPCPHKTVGTDGKCETCGYQYAVCGTRTTGSESEIKYYTSVTAAMGSDDGCNSVKLLADCDEEVEYNFQGTVDLNGHTLTALNVQVETGSEYSLTIEDNSTAKTGTITTLTVNSKTTLEGGNFGMITTGENGGNIPLPVGYAFQHTGDNDSGTDFVKRSEIGSSLSDVKVVEVVNHTTHEYANGMCEICGEECQHGTVSDEGVCSTCNQQFAGKVINNGTTKWFATFSKAWQEIMKQQNSPVPVQFELYQDIKESGTLDVSGLDLILCLNGHTLERENFEVANGKLSLTSGNGKSGTLVGPVTSGTDGQFSTSGDVTINGDVTLGSSSDSLGVGTTILGKVTSTSGKTIQAHLSGTHPVLFTKGEDGKYTQFVSGNATEITGAVRVVQCTHDEVTDGKCDYCGGTLVAQIGSTNYTSFATAYNAAKDGETIALLSNVSDAMTINDSSKKITLDLNGKTVSSLTVSVPATITDSMGGGTITELTTTGDVKVGGLLAAGYGFKSSSAWYDGSSTKTSVSNVSVKKLPIQSLIISTNGNKTSFAYGEGIWLVATPMLTGTSTPTYEWMNMDGSEQTIEDKQGFWLYSLAPKEYTIQCTVTVDGYSISEHIEFTVTKATPTVATAPTAKTGLSYNGSNQELINAGSFGSNVTITASGFPKFWYGTKDADNKFSWFTRAVTGRNAGEYTVYWYIAGGTNYNDVGSAENPAGTFTVTIDPQSVTATVDAISAQTYTGSTITPDVTVKVGETPLTKDTDYTLICGENINAGTNAGSVTVKAKSGSNYTFSDVTKTFTIDKADARTLDNITVNRKYTTTGEQSTQIGSIMPADAGTLSYSVGSSSVSGTATVSSFTVSDSGLVKYTITGGTVGTVITLPVKINSTNYAESTVNVVVTLTEKDDPTVTANDITATYTGEPIPASTITGTATFNDQTVAGSWGFTDTGASFKNVTDSRDGVSVTFTPADTTNFNAVTTTIKVTINKATPTGSPKYTAISTSGKTLADANLTTEDGTFSVPGTVKWIDADGNDLAETTEVAANTTYKWLFTPTDTANYNAINGSITLWHRSSGGSSGGSSSNSTSTTVKNPDGSTTTTVTDKKTGTVTETTKNTDGSTTTVETKKDGTVTETNITPNGTTSTTVTDKNGNSETTVTVSKKDAQSGEAITLPVDEVTACSSENATEISVEVPSSGATVEIPVKNPTPGTVIVIVDKDGNETVVPTTKQTENGVSVTLTEDATIKVIENSKDFSDVRSSDYFDKAVDWASSRGITGGTGADTFSPDASCGRAQLVTFLWRAAGCPEAKGGKTFDDVNEDAYYTEAVKWAASLGIAGGYDNGLFGSDDTITREQMAVILYRFAQHTGMDTTQGGMAVREYKDYDSISDYAVTAMQWAVNAGVMQGYDGNLMPGQPCTRAQIVTMLYRLLSA